MNRQNAQISVPATALVWGIVVICSVIELVLQLADRGWLEPADLRALVYDYGAFWPGLLQGWAGNYPSQPVLMFVTYAFLHGGALHLLFNMVTLCSLGRLVIDQAGQGGFLSIYLASTLGGALLYGVLSTTGQPMVGASGALFGLAGAILLWVWCAQPSLAQSIRATWRIYAFLIIYNVIMYYALDGGLAWETHLGGFAAGWIVAWLFRERH